MQLEQKNNIIKALESYMDLHKVSQNEIAKKADVNAAYIVNMRKGVFATNGGTEFSDKYFIRIANLIGFELEKNEIGTKLTPQFKFMTTNLTESKNNAETCVLIMETGAGKTYSLDVFRKKYPADVFTVKIGSSDTISDILNKISDELRLSYFKGTKAARIGLICRHLIRLKYDGYNPQLNLDEAEYMNQSALCAYKEIYDACLGICPVNLIGTPELLANIERLILKKKAGIAQTWRRLKFKVKHGSKINKDRYELFLEGIDPEFKKWLRINCENFGELTDILKPCMRESEKLNEPLDLKLACKVFGFVYETERKRQ